MHNINGDKVVFDELRNKLAHTGKAVKDDEFNRVKEKFEQLEKIISPEKCSYNIINYEIKKLIEFYSYQEF